MHELPSWWVGIKGESAPRVLASERGRSVTYTSPSFQRPDDTVRLTLGFDTDRHGCVLTTEIETAQPFLALEAVTLRHRWGEDLDRDLRGLLDDGWPVRVEQDHRVQGSPLRRFRTRPALPAHEALPA